MIKMISALFFNMKNFILIIGSLAILIPTTTSALSSSVDSCPALDQIIGQSQAVISQREQKWQTNLADKLKLETAQNKDRLTKLTVDFKRDDQRWENRFTELKKLAKTTKEKQLAGELEGKIKQLIIERRGKAQTALTNFQTAKEKVLTSYALEVKQATADFKNQFSQTIVETKRLCGQTSAEKFTGNRRVKAEGLALKLNQIKLIKQRELKTANDIYKRALEQASTDFRLGVKAEEKWWQENLTN